MVVPAHNLARWIHARLDVAEGVMRWETQRTFLGIVPLGRRRVEVPATEVSQIRLGRRLRPSSLLIGLAIMVIPFLLGWGWWAVSSLPMGLWVVVVSMGPRMEAKTITGRTHRVDVCFGHQIDAELYIAAVEDIASRQEPSGEWNHTT